MGKCSVRSMGHSVCARPSALRNSWVSGCHAQRLQEPSGGLVAADGAGIVAPTGSLAFRTNSRRIRAIFAT